MAMTPEQNATIAAFWEQHKNDPQTIMDAMTKYGVGVDDLANAIGRNRSEVGNYLVDAGAAQGFGGFNKGITDTYYGSAIQPSQYELAQVEAARSPNVVVGPTPAGMTAGQMLQNPNPPAPRAPYMPQQQGPVIQPGTSPGWNPNANAQPALQPYQQPVYQMPVLDALYRAQQQRMSAPAPRFNFQSQSGPLTATAAPQGIAAGEPATGALTNVINGG